MNWQLLSSELSQETLAALKAHIDSRSDDDDDDDDDDEDDNNNGAVGIATDEVLASSSNEGKSWKDAINAEYKEQWYWEERFGDEESFEWLLNFEQVERYLLPHLKKEDSILVIGLTLHT